jgi:hypothetical protein
MDLSKGLLFTGRWFKGTVKVVEVKEATNELKVECKSPGLNSWWDETWNLQHTYWGFENGDYFIDKNVTG